MKANRDIVKRTFIRMVILVLILAVIILSVVFVRTRLLENTNQLGMALAQSYAFEEEYKLDTHEKILTLAIEYIEEMEISGAENSEIQTWMQDYFEKLTKIVGYDTISPYAVINGEIVAAIPWEGDDTYDYFSTDWYMNALKNKGEIAYSDAYTDAITGMTIYTVSCQITSGDVIAMDVYIKNQDLLSSMENLPLGTSVYLCDSKGMVLQSSSQTPGELCTSHISSIFQGIKNGEFENSLSTVTDDYGQVRGVYYHQMENGWTYIVTIPIKQIFMGNQDIIVYTLSGVGIFLFVLLLYMVIRELNYNRKIKKSDDTIHILSDSYYAIYRVNFVNGSYEKIKNDSSNAAQIPDKGRYEDLIKEMSEYILPQANENFDKAYSINSISQRVNDRIKDYGSDYQRKFEDGVKWINVRSLYDYDMSKDEVILAFKEIDDEKKRSLQNLILLQDAIEESRKNAKSQSEFFSNMSHDMRTPLNAIIGFSKLALKNTEDTQKVCDYLSKIEISASQMLNLVNDILEISKIEAGKSNLNYAEFNIKEHIEQLSEVYKAQAANEDKIFTVSCNIKNENVIGDYFKISQILNNLISNSFKYSKPKARISLDIRQFDFKKHSKYQIAVSDTGVGMSEDFIKSIFEPYTRETLFNNVKTAGTGLGMAIVKSLVNQMSGEISVESQLGKGSKFTVTLPLETSGKQEKQWEKDTEKNKNINFDLSQKNVLVAEDNQLNMEIVTEFLKLKGCNVIQAENGLRAFEIFEKSKDNSIDAVLMDMQMPVMDGCDAAEKIRSLNRHDAKTVPIIAVTANAFAQDIDKTTKAGMDGHISKPVDAQQLYSILDFFMKRGDK